MKNLEKAIFASIKAGEAILEVYQKEDFEVSIKQDKSPLTEADKRAHNKIVSILEETRIPVLSEEGKETPYEERKDRDLFWLIDPLDGTKEFIKRNGEFTVNIALIKNNKPIAGVIYIPVKDILYFAHNEIGSFKCVDVKDKSLDLESLKTSSFKLPQLDNNRAFTVVASRSHINDETREYIEKVSQGKESVDIVSKGSSIKICLVAEGTADSYPRFGPTMEWDTGAGHAILKYAGGKLTRTDNNQELEYNKENLLNPYFIAER